MSATTAQEPVAAPAGDDSADTPKPPVEGGQIDNEAVEQKATTGTKEQIEAPPREANSAPVDRSQHHQAAARIRESRNLPKALKERVAALIETSGEQSSGNASGVSIDEAIRAIEDALPEFLRRDERGGKQVEHPDGDGFFNGDPHALSDTEAEELARGQLARSGLLRGQRARVAE